jgi:RNA polymerase sigma-70 factor (ECF subfamily)
MPEDETEDESLMRGLAEAESAALRALYRKYGGLVYGLALKVCGDSGMAEEVVQDVFLRVWRGASSYSRDKGAVATWLGRIARNRAIDALRGARARYAVVRDDWADREDPRALDPEEEASRASSASVLRAAVAQLPEEQRLALSLAFFRGMTHSEIAEALSLPLGTVKSRIREAMLSLRRKIGEGGGK